MNPLIALLAVLSLKVTGADDCIDEIVAIFSNNERNINRNSLNFITKTKRFTINQISINKPPFYNIFYDSIEISDLDSRFKEKLPFIIDMEFVDNKYYAVMREYKTIKLVQLDFETGRQITEFILDEPDAVYLKSFIITSGLFSFFFELNNIQRVKKFKLILNEGYIDLAPDHHEDYLDFELDFDKATTLEFGWGIDLKFAFLRGQQLYLSNKNILNSSEDLGYFGINVNRFTNCLLTLCAAGQIDGFLYYKSDGDSKNYNSDDDSENYNSSNVAILVNNNYFLVSDITNINGSIPVQHFFHYEYHKSSFFCELAFTMKKSNYCYRDRRIRVFEMSDNQLKIETMSAADRNTFYLQFRIKPESFINSWQQTKRMPIAVIELFDEIAILYPSSYRTQQNKTEIFQPKDYDYLFPTYDETNLILKAFYDESAKRYLFLGSKFNFMFRHSQLNEHNQFYGDYIPLSHPLYTNCVQSRESEKPFILSLILAIFICFALIVLMLIFIYLRHDRFRITFQPSIVHILRKRQKKATYYKEKKLPLKSKSKLLRKF